MQKRFKPMTSAAVRPGASRQTEATRKSASANPIQPWRNRYAGERLGSTRTATATGPHSAATRVSRRATILLLLIFAAMVLLPGATAWITRQQPLPPIEDWTSQYDGHAVVRVYKLDGDTAVSMPESDYIMNVLAGEITPDAPAAVLQVAAIACRTYVADHQSSRSAPTPTSSTTTPTSANNMAFAHQADVTDNPSLDEPWMTVADQQTKFKDAYPWAASRYREAVLKTDGEILMSGGRVERIGSGLGMSLHQATALANKGWSAARILKQVFPDANLGLNPALRRNTARSQVVGSRKTVVQSTN